MDLLYVYRNLHTGGFSVKHKNKVIKIVDSIILQNVEFRVRKGGRARAVKEGQRNVHAFCVGYELNKSYLINKKDLLELTYNPFKNTSFVFKNSGEAIYKSNIAVLQENRLFVPQKDILTIL